MTMIEHPRIGEAFDVELREDMVCSMHPHVISEDERTCLYFQDTWHVQRDRAVAFSGLAIDFYDPHSAGVQTSSGKVQAA
jgi:Xaa-Pro dipeptidase